VSKYVYKPYDAVFPGLFEAEKVRLEAALGSRYQIEHMGSTAVPGLGGKGIIDIYVIAPYAELTSVSSQLRRMGYEFVLESSWLERLFHKQDLPDGKEGTRRYHIHVVGEGGEDLKNGLAFRDYLRAHPDSAQEYAKAKKKAAKAAAEVPEQDRKLTYMAIKAPVIKDIIQKASAV